MSIWKGWCQNPKRTDSVESSLTALITFDMYFTLVCCIFLQIHDLESPLSNIRNKNHQAHLNHQREILGQAPEKISDISSKNSHLGISPDFTIPFGGGEIYPPWNDVPPSLFWELAARLASDEGTNSIHCREILCCERKYVSTNGATRDFVPLPCYFPQNIWK